MTTFVLHLAVDDEPDIRLLARALLEAAGYRVVGEAAGGVEARIEYHRLNPPPEETVIFFDNRTWHTRPAIACRIASS